MASKKPTLFSRVHTKQIPSFLAITALREIIRNYHDLCKDYFLAFRASCRPVERKAAANNRLRQAWARVMAKQTKITIETDSLLVLWGRSPLRSWCPQCAAVGEMIPIKDVGVISNLALFEMEAWLESEVIHRSQSVDGSALICLNSLLKRVHKTKSA